MTTLSWQLSSSGDLKPASQGRWKAEGSSPKMALFRFPPQESSSDSSGCEVRGRTVRCTALLLRPVRATQVADFLPLRQEQYVAALSQQEEGQPFLPSFSRSRLSFFVQQEH